MRSVQTFGLKTLRQADIQQHRFRTPGQADRFFFKGGVFLVQPFEALGITGLIWEKLRKQRQRLIHHLRIDHAAASALVPGMGREIANDGDLRFFLQGQDIVLVLQ